MRALPHDVGLPRAHDLRRREHRPAAARAHGRRHRPHRRDVRRLSRGARARRWRARGGRRPLAVADRAAPAEKSEVCLGCHTPDATDGAPAASAAALWLGRGGLDPATGAPLAGPTPHGALAGGCVGCHQAGPAVERGAGHAFVAGDAACARCHAKAFPPEDLPARARALWSAWRARADEQAPAQEPGEDGPPHARAAHLDRATPLGRAAWDVALVLEDPAAAAHNAPYARQLLAAAERALNGQGAEGHPGGHP